MKRAWALALLVGCASDPTAPPQIGDPGTQDSTPTPPVDSVPTPPPVDSTHPVDSTPPPVDSTPSLVWTVTTRETVDENYDSRNPCNGDQITYAEYHGAWVDSTTTGQHIVSTLFTGQGFGPSDRLYTDSTTVRIFDSDSLHTTDWHIRILTPGVGLSLDKEIHIANNVEDHSSTCF